MRAVVARRHARHFKLHAKQSVDDVAMEQLLQGGGWFGQPHRHLVQQLRLELLGVLLAGKTTAERYGASVCERVSPPAKAQQNEERFDGAPFVGFAKLRELGAKGHPKLPRRHRVGGVVQGAVPGGAAGDDTSHGTAHSNVEATHKFRRAGAS